MGAHVRADALDDGEEWGSVRWARTCRCVWECMVSRASPRNLRDSVCRRPAQVVSDAASVVSPSLPQLIARLYNVVAVLQLQGVLLAPSCTGAPPFETEYSTMAAALGLWVTTALIHYSWRHPIGRLGGQFVLMWAMVRWMVGSGQQTPPNCGGCMRCARLPNRYLCRHPCVVFAQALYPATTLTAVELVVCNPVVLSAQGASSLDGGPPLSPGTPPDAVVSLYVSARNSFFVCWAGHHAGVGALAAVVLPVYVFGLPALTLWWLWRDPWVTAEVRRAEAISGGEAYAPSPSQPSARGVDDCVGAGAGSARTSLDLSPPAVELALASAQPGEGAPAAVPDPLLGVFFYDYKPTAWYTKHIDLALLLLLSLFRALLPRPADLIGIVAKAAAICTALLAASVHVLWARPYLDADAWMGWVRAENGRQWEGGSHQLACLDGLGRRIGPKACLVRRRRLTADMPFSLCSCHHARS